MSTTKEAPEMFKLETGVQRKGKAGHAETDIMRKRIDLLVKSMKVDQSFVVPLKSSSSAHKHLVDHYHTKTFRVERHKEEGIARIFRIK